MYPTASALNGDVGIRAIPPSPHELPETGDTVMYTEWVGSVDDDDEEDNDSDDEEGDDWGGLGLQTSTKPKPIQGLLSKRQGTLPTPVPLSGPALADKLITHSTLPSCSLAHLVQSPTPSLPIPATAVPILPAIAPPPTTGWKRKRGGEFGPEGLAKALNAVGLQNSGQVKRRAVAKITSHCHANSSFPAKGLSHIPAVLQGSGIITQAESPQRDGRGVVQWQNNAAGHKDRARIDPRGIPGLTQVSSQTESLKEDDISLDVASLPAMSSIFSLSASKEADCVVGILLSRYVSVCSLKGQGNVGHNSMIGVTVGSHDSLDAQDASTWPMQTDVLLAGSFSISPGQHACDATVTELLPAESVPVLKQTCTSPMLRIPPHSFTKVSIGMGIEGAVVDMNPVADMNSAGKAQGKPVQQMDDEVEMGQSENAEKEHGNQMEVDIHDTAAASECLLGVTTAVAITLPVKLAQASSATNRGHRPAYDLAADLAVGGSMSNSKECRELEELRRQLSLLRPNCGEAVALQKKMKNLKSKLRKKKRQTCLTVRQLGLKIPDSRFSREPMHEFLGRVIASNTDTRLNLKPDRTRTRALESESNEREAAKRRHLTMN
jgi:hypothetical protein